MSKRLACAVWAILVPCSVLAAPVRYILAPGTVQLQFRAYGLGMVPIDGGFTRFSGTLELDPADPGYCALDLKADAASLRMPSESMTADALGPDLLDVARFPEFHVQGRCHGGTLNATLSLHGVAGAVPMAVTMDKAAWTATGTMHRAAWGMGARPLLAGPDVRVRMVAGLPKAAD